LYIGLKENTRAIGLLSDPVETDIYRMKKAQRKLAHSLGSCGKFNKKVCRKNMEILNKLRPFPLRVTAHESQEKHKLVYSTLPFFDSFKVPLMYTFVLSSGGEESARAARYADLHRLLTATQGQSVAVSGKLSGGLKGQSHQMNIFKILQITLLYGCALTGFHICECLSCE
jgi:hypothetical protein